jgi:CheY-like chemotaxis protein
MPNPESELIKNLISERLKHVDALVKQQKIDDAEREIVEIRKLDSRNPYALAYEERILTLKKSIETQRSTEQKGRPSVVSEPSQAPVFPAQGGSSALTGKASVDIPRETIPTSSPATHSDPDSHLDSNPTAQEEHESRSQKGKATILLVDDDTMLIQALAQFLEDNRYSVEKFTRSEEALEYLKGNSPDLIICDVNLETSSFGGFTLHEKMRKLDHLRDVPFLFLSGLNDSAIVLAGKELGADDYLTKPVEPEALLAVVKGKLKRYRQIKRNT